MVLSASGSFILQGEVTIILAAMKRANKWSSHEQIEENDPLMKEFLELKESLNSDLDISSSDAASYLHPFLELIRSPNTTGPVTGIALSSVDKIVSYGLIDINGSSAAAAVENIADAVTHARFLGTDPGSDEVVLLKILHVLRTLFLAPCGTLLTNESVCEIMQSCFRICFEMRLSELLRKTAEHTLIEMTQLLFSRLDNMSEDNRWGMSIKKLKMRTGAIDTNKKKNETSSKKQARQAAAKQSEKNKSSSNVSSPSEEKKPLPSKPTTDQKEEKKEEDQESLKKQNEEEAEVKEDAGKEEKQVEEKTEPEESLQEQQKEEVDEEMPKDSQDTEGVQQEAPKDQETSKDFPQEPISIGTKEEEQVVQAAEVPKEEAFEVVTPSASSEVNNSGDSGESVEDGSGQTDSGFQPSEEKTETDSVEDNNQEQTTSGEGKQNLISLSLPEVGSTASLNELERKEEAEAATAEMEDYVNQQGVRFMPEPESHSNSDETQLIPYGLPSVRELFRFMTSLINPLDKRNNNAMALVGLSLLSVALETGGRQMGKFQSLRSLVEDDLCRNLLQLLSNERLSVVAATSRVCLLLFESLRHHLKFQFESYLLKLIDIVTTESPKVSYNQREIALDSIISLWKIPGIVTELYLNYDCDLYGSDLFEDIVKTLSKNTFPVSGLYSTHILSLDALLAVIDTIESRCHSRILEDPRGSYQYQNRTPREQKSINSSQTCAQQNTDGSQEACEIPSHECLVAIKHRKKILASGSEQFNIKPSRGISFLQENSLLKEPLDPIEVSTFMKENHRLEKKMIGEFISSRKNVAVLEAFVQSFDFFGVRIDNALRQYLETFRLPGEAPLIQLIMEHFADHWHKSNGEPYANSDSAFTLAYAIIMLNVDQHNHNVKKQNKPMTVEEFMRNLKGVNGGTDFNAQLLEEIYNSIRGEEIVMPAEQTGIVKENYLWKVLLKRGSDPQSGQFLRAPNGSFDHDLFSVTWGPTVTALSYVLDKSNDKILIQKALSGFRKCAMISAHYGMSDVFDHLTISLCNFTMLQKTTEGTDQVIATLGSNYKAQMALKTVFNLTHRHGDILRDGWKNLLDCFYQFYKCQLLNEEVTKADDFVDPKGYVYLKLRKQTPPSRQDTGIFSSIYSYIAMSESPRERLADKEQEELRESAKDCVESCLPEQLISDSKFLRTGSLQELVKALIFASAGPDQLAIVGNYDEDSTILFMELLIKIVIQNRDRAGLVWTVTRDHLYSLMMGAAAAGNLQLLERSVVAILRLAVGLIRRQNMATQVLQSLRMLLLLKPICLHRVCRQVSFALFELLRSNATNINDATDWSTIITLMECVGAGARPPLPVSSAHPSDQGTASGSEGTIDSGHISDVEKDYVSDPEIYSSGGDEQSPQRTVVLQKINQPQSPSGNGSNASSSSSWILVGKEGEIEPVFSPSEESITYNITTTVEFVFWDRKSFLKCVESLSFLVKDAALITPANFIAVIRACRVFIEASLMGGKRSRPGRESKKKKNVKSSKKKEQSLAAASSHDDDGEDDENFDGCNQAILQLLDLMHALHTRAAHVFHTLDKQSEPTALLWSTCWCPLLQGIARLCTVTTRQVRMVAVTYLQRALLAEDLQNLTAIEWEACFNKVLFPLLVKLLEPLSPKDPTGMEETRVRVATLLSKVFLQHLTPLLSLPTFTALWLTILDFLDKYMHADRGDLLCEAIPESLKNMLLVMSSAGVFEGDQEENPLWSITWDRIHSFLPGLKQELLKSHPPSEPGRKAETTEQVKQGEKVETPGEEEKTVKEGEKENKSEEKPKEAEQKEEVEKQAAEEEEAEEEKTVKEEKSTEEIKEENPVTVPEEEPSVPEPPRKTSSPEVPLLTNRSEVHGVGGKIETPPINAILAPPLPSGLVLPAPIQAGASLEGMYQPGNPLVPSPTHHPRTSPTLMAPLHHQSAVTPVAPLSLHTSAVASSPLLWGVTPQQGTESSRNVPLMLNTKMFPTTNLSGPIIPEHSQASSSEDESKKSGENS